VDLAAADRGDVVERLLEQCGKFLLPAGDGGDAELARCRPAWRGVESEHRQAEPVELRLHRGRGVVIGKLQLDGAEAGRGRRRETLDQRAFGEEISQVGCKARHAGSGLGGWPLGRDLRSASGPPNERTVASNAVSIHPAHMMKAWRVQQ
jgi:hypothetical protein